MKQVAVHFEGEGAGTAELSWGQLEILGAMRRQRTRMPLPLIEALPPGTTLDEVLDRLRYMMSRHQAMRTRLEVGPDGPVRQVLHGSGDIAVGVIDAGDEEPLAVAKRLLEWRDRYVERDYDFAREWPIFMAVVLKDGAPAYRLITICHVVMDAFAALPLGEDLTRWDAGEPPRPVTATQPLEQARWQRSPEGQRHCAAVLRHWEGQLRQMPARRFPPPADRGEPRYWRLTFVSPATHLATRIIAGRTGAGIGQVVLTLFLVAMARVTGINPPVTRVAVNNRFRRGLADSVSIITQYGLCGIDVAGVTFDEALDRLSRRILTTFKNAYYDPSRLDELVERVSRERGEEVDVHCYYNDRRLSRDGDTGPGKLPTTDEMLAARPLTTIQDAALSRAAERLFVAVEEAPGSFRLMLDGDTRYMSREAMAACARTMEEMAVAAALDAAAPTGVPGS